MLDVLAELPELTLHAFPRTACRDAHLLVVVAGRAAGGKGIVQPEVVLGGDVVGDVGEGCRALVGGDHEVGIVAVVAQHVPGGRSEEHTSELQSLMRISYAVFCLKKKTEHKYN